MRLSRKDVEAMEQLILRPIQKYIVLPESKITCSMDSALSHMIDRDAEHRQHIAELEAMYADSCSAMNALHAQVVNRVKELEAEVARLNKAMDPIDLECCELQAKWKVEAQWAAKYVRVHTTLKSDLEHAQRILDGTL